MPKQACDRAASASFGEWVSPRSACPLSSLPIPCPHQPPVCCTILQGIPRFSAAGPGWGPGQPRGSTGALEVRDPPTHTLPMLTTLSPTGQCIDDD